MFNAGTGLGLATPLTTAVSDTFSLDKKCIYSVAERPYDHIKRETFQTRAPASLQRQARVKRARKQYCARSSIARTKTPARAVSFHIKARNKLCACNVVIS